MRENKPSDSKSTADNRPELPGIRHDSGTVTTQAFYTRNPHIVRPVPNAVSPSELLDFRSRETILRNAFLHFRDVRKWRGRTLVEWVGCMTAFGSGYSHQVCEELGWDACMKISPNSNLPRRRP